MSRLGQTDAGELFARPKGRAAGLSGALAPRRPAAAVPADDRPQDEAPAPEAAPEAEPEVSRTGPAEADREWAEPAPQSGQGASRAAPAAANPARRSQRRARPTRSQESQVDLREQGSELPTSQQIVVVYILPEDAEWIAEQRRLSERTNAQVVLAAIEQTAARLPDEFRPTPPTHTGLFATLAQPAVGERERHVQLGLRGILPQDRAVLADMVTATGAGSLSALVRAALRLTRAQEQG